MFKCVACEAAFHGDCEGLCKGEKKLAQKTSGVKTPTPQLHALCALCARTSRAVWNAANRDASKVTLALATLAAKKMKKAEVVALAKEFELDDMTAELLDFSVSFHETGTSECESAADKIRQLQEATTEVLFSRMPDATLFGDDLVQVFQRAAVKRANGTEDAGEEGVIPSPLVAAGKDVSTALALAARKRSLLPEDEDGEGEGSAGSQAQSGRKHDRSVSCPGCNLPGTTWNTTNCFQRHLRAPKVCPDTKWPEDNTPMDSTVHLNLRAGFQVAPKGRPKKQGRGTDTQLAPLEACSYCGEGESDQNPLLKCITYDEKIEPPLTQTWWTEQKTKLCSHTLHLSCARSQNGALPGNATYQGTVPIEEAGRNVIGFCKECFPRMEAAREVEPVQPPATAEEATTA